MFYLPHCDPLNILAQTPNTRHSSVITCYKCYMLLVSTTGTGLFKQIPNWIVNTMLMKSCRRYSQSIKWVSRGKCARLDQTQRYKQMERFRIFTSWWSSEIYPQSALHWSSCAAFSAMCFCFFHALQCSRSDRTRFLSFRIHYLSAKICYFNCS